MGELTCRSTGTDSPQLVAIICHGFGAGGDDLVPLAGELLRASESIRKHVRFIFPEAPLSLHEYGMPGGRAWWMIDMVKLQRAAEMGEFRDLRNEMPPRLPTARAELMSVVHAVREQYGLPLSRIVLGGFSQGAMLSTDVALRLEANPAALLIWSGTLLCESQWRELAPQRAGLTVLQSHGTEDTILPFIAAEWLKDLLTEAKLAVDFRSFQGGHTIPFAGLAGAGQILDDLVNQK